METIEQTELIARIDRLVKALEKPQSPEETLWDMDQIAEWLGLSKRTVETKVVTRADFPKGFRPVDNAQAQGHRRWFAASVIEWARQSSDTLPVRRGRPRQ